MAFLSKHQYNGLAACYTKPQLIKLCEGYGVMRIRRLNKKNIAQRLAATIAGNRGLVAPAAVDSRQYSVVSSEMDEASGRVCVRLSSVSTEQPSHSGVVSFYDTLLLSVIPVYLDMYRFLNVINRIFHD